MKEFLAVVNTGVGVGCLIVFCLWAGIDNHETIKQTEALQSIAKQLEEK